MSWTVDCEPDFIIQYLDLINLMIEQEQSLVENQWKCILLPNFKLKSTASIYFRSFCASVVLHCIICLDTHCIVIFWAHLHSSIQASDCRVDEASDNGVKDEGQNLKRSRKDKKYVPLSVWSDQSRPVWTEKWLSSLINGMIIVKIMCNDTSAQ